MSGKSNETALVRIAENGRLSIPAKQRKLLGLEEGGLVVARVRDGELRLRPVGRVLADIQARVARYVKTSGDTVDRFLADRRAEAAREEAEMDRHFAGRSTADRNTVRDSRPSRKGTGEE